MRYDNKADPTAFENGQYAWHTEFDHIGAQLDLPSGFGVIGQWISGYTGMGYFTGEYYMVDVEFESAYLMLTKKLGDHRLSVRYDTFEGYSYDDIPGDSSDEEGNAWTVSYRHRFGDRIQVAAEWVRIRNDRMAHMYYGLPVDSTEEQLQLTLMLRFAR